MPGWSDVQYFFEAVISIFAIINPIGNLPVLAGLTEGMTVQERRRIFRLAGTVGLGILLAMAVLGQFLIEIVFRIRIPEFALAGGVMLAVVGIRNLLAGSGSHAAAERVLSEAQREEAQVTLAVTPIASPLLVGPGSIVTVMLIVQRYTQEHGPILGRIYGVAASLVAFAFVMLILNWSHQLLRLMGRIGTLAVGRIMQIFIVAIGVHFVFSALRQLVPAMFNQ